MDEDYIDIESEEVDLHVQQELVEGVSVSVAWQQPTGPGFKSLELMRSKAEKDFYENVALPAFAAIRSARVKGIDQYKLELEVENGLSSETEKMWYYIQVPHRKDGHKGRLTYNEVFGGQGQGWNCARRCRRHRLGQRQREASEGNEVAHASCRSKSRRPQR